MLIRYTVFLSFFACTLAAQSTGWQAYLNSTHIIGGVEAEGHLWLACSNSIAKIDPQTGDEKLLHFQNSPIPSGMSDIQTLGNDDFVILGGGNKMVTRQGGQWTTRTLQPLVGANLYFIAGQTQDQALILGGQNQLYKLAKDGELQYLPYGENTLPSNDIQSATLDRQDRLWVMIHNRVVQFSPEGNILVDLEVEQEYLYDMQIDEEDNLWLTSNTHVYLWRAAENAWKNITTQDLGFSNSGGVINATTGSSATITFVNKVMNIDYHDEAFQVEDWSSYFTTKEIPGTHNYQDQKGNLWYFGQDRNILQWEIGRQEPETSAAAPWLGVSDASALGLDPQGKVWLGGMAETAYLHGGKWHSTPLDTASYFSIGINDFTFRPDGIPIVGTGNFFTFGFPDSQVRQYNGTSWDTLTAAVISTSFLPVTDVIWDQKDNLWVLRANNTILSVRNRGDWNRIRASDLPMPTSTFTCLAEDPKGGMWIGTNNSLLYHDGFTITHTDAATLQSDGYPVISIAIDESGKKWITLGDGSLRREKDHGWEVVEEVEALVSSNLLEKVVCGNYPEVWVTVSWNGVLHYDGKTWEHLMPENSGLIYPYIRDMLLDGRGRMWFCHRSGASVYTGEGQPIESYGRPATQAIGVYPNPGCCLFAVSWEAVQVGDYELQMHNASGQLVRQWKVKAELSGEQTLSFSQDDLPAGSYFLTVSQNKHQIGTATIVVLQ